MRALLIAAALALASCSGEPQRVGLTEPFTVRNGVFKEGALPGTPPSDGGVSAPTVTAIESAGALIATAQAAKVYLGRTSPEAYAVGVRLEDEGTGWWSIPVGGADPSFGNELTWQFTADFGGGLAPGLHRLRFVALDSAGRAGTQRDVRVCAVPPVPDNLHACDPTIAPPRAVISLSWDSDADLDLVVVTPDGKVVDARHPTTAAVDGTSVPADRLRDPSTGALDRNSNAGCAIDRIRRENLVWQGDPVPGTYRLYVNLFDACRTNAARYRLGVWRASTAGDGGVGGQTETTRRDGILTAQAANGGASRGTFVTEVTFP